MTITIIQEQQRHNQIIIKKDFKLFPICLVTRYSNAVKSSWRITRKLLLTIKEVLNIIYYEYNVFSSERYFSSQETEKTFK